jgi:hypothetical protein
MTPISVSLVFRSPDRRYLIVFPSARIAALLSVRRECLIFESFEFLARARHILNSSGAAYGKKVLPANSDCSGPHLTILLQVFYGALATSTALWF